MIRLRQSHQERVGGGSIIAQMRRVSIVVKPPVAVVSFSLARSRLGLHKHHPVKHTKQV